MAAKIGPFVRRLAKPHTIALIAILGVAFGLRVWGISFGLPYAYHYDEGTYISNALRLGSGSLGSPNPTGFSNILLIEYVGYFAVGKLLGLFDSVADFELAYRTDPSTFYTLARASSVIAGTLTVAAVYWMGKRLRGTASGLVAALFLAFAFLHIRDSHYAVPDILATFLMSLAVGAFVAATRTRAPGYLYTGALVTGLAIAAKWTAVVLAVPLALAVVILVRSRAARGQPSQSAVRTVVLCGGFLAAGVIVGFPQFLLRPATYLDYALTEYQAGASGGFWQWEVDSVSGYVFYAKTLLYGLGPGLLLLAALGFVGRTAIVVRRRDPVGFVLLSFPIAYYLLMGSTRHYFARYALPLLPFCALLATDSLGFVLSLSRRKLSELQSGVVVGLIAIGVVVQPTLSAIRHDYLLTEMDTRTSAKDWIEANVPEGSKLAVDWPVHGPPLSTQEKAVPNSRRTYNVTIVGGSGLSEHSAEYYRQNGYDYLISSSFIYNIPLVDKERDAARRAFYASLDKEFKLVKEFKPYSAETEPSFIFDQIYGPVTSLLEFERPGPTLKVYQVTDK